MIIILQLQYVALPFIEKKGPYSWQSPLVLQQQFLLYSLVTDLQCYSGSHAPSPKGWAMIHLKPIKETPLLLTSGVCPTSVHVPYFWPNRHKGGFFCDTEKKKCKDKDLSSSVLHSYFVWRNGAQRYGRHLATSLWKNTNTLRLEMQTDGKGRVISLISLSHWTYL